jgi:hypothetical protein
MRKKTQATKLDIPSSAHKMLIPLTLGIKVKPESARERRSMKATIIVIINRTTGVSGTISQVRE